MKQKKVQRKLLLFFPAVFFFLGTCGLEDYPYIYPIPQSRITRELNNRATIPISNNNASTSFSHFVVFYRIYASDLLLASTMSSTEYSSINSVLSSDYNSVHPYIDSDTNVNTNMDTFFKGKDYKYLEISDSNGGIIRLDEESLSILGSTLTFDFSTGMNPRMTASSRPGETFSLRRSNDSGQFELLPAHGYFVNDPQLYDRANITSTINADVEDKTGTNNRYTYAAMFIAGAGIDNNTYSYIYSTPSLVHVFMLPDPW